jgi:hypothetical protein
MPREMMELHTRPLFAFQAEVAKPNIIGMTPGHDRRVGIVTCGSFEGERLRGKIHAGGSDWQSLRSDGALTLDVRCIMETDDGHLIGMTYRGMRHGPKEVLDRIARGEAVSPSEACAQRRQRGPRRRVRTTHPAKSKRGPAPGSR